MAALRIAKFSMKSSLTEKLFLTKQHISSFRNTSAYVFGTRMHVYGQTPISYTTCTCQQPSNSHFFHTSRWSYGKIVQFNLSDIGEGIREVIVKEWFVKVGDSVSQFDKICEVQSDKASVTITSRYDGIVTKLYHDVDGMALVGEPLIDIEVIGEDSQQQVHSISLNPEVASKVESDFSPMPTQFLKTFATPAVRRLAAENKLTLSDIIGSGKNGRVLKEDIVAFLSRDKTPFKPEQPSKRHSPSVDTPVPIQGFRKAMVKTMIAAQKIPHLVYSDEVSMSELVALCKKLKPASEARGLKITYMPFFIKAASKALKEYPVINSSVDENCEHITFKTSHNIGVAMDTPNGLVVPNLKNVDELSIYQIAVELSRLRHLGLQGKLGLADVTGGTLTLSNIGAIGGTYCSPLILSPEVAIAAIGKVQVVPRYNLADELVKSHVMCISWSADHRVVDGATIARFSNLWKEYIENPEIFMLDL